MCEVVVEISDDEDSALPEIIPKDDGLNYDPGPGMDIASSSSGINLRSSFIAMGFSPSRVDKAIQENGHDNAELLLEILSAPPVIKQPKTELFDDGLFSGSNNASAASFHTREALHKAESSDSLDSLFDEDISKNACGARGLFVKEELDVGNGVSDEKMASLLKMNFSLEEVRLALDRLGKNASMDQLINFIFATRMAKKYEKKANFQIRGDEESKKDCNNEALFGIMDKTLQLLEMGFSEQEISTAFEKCGSEVALEVLANSIVAPETVIAPYVDKHSSNYSSSSEQNNGQFLYGKARDSSSSHPFDPFTIIKTEDYSSDTTPQGGLSDLLEKLKGKRPKVEHTNESDLLEKLKGKRPKVEHTNEPINWMKPKEEFREDTNTNNPVVGQMKVGSTSANNWRKARAASARKRGVPAPPQERFDHFPIIEEDIKPTMSTPNPPSRTLNSVASKPPYFLYGNVTNLSRDSWVKISHFLCSIPPEFINSQLYSALTRTEGYVHNLPIEDRSYVSPKGPMTIQEALPHTRKWWPGWDTRKHLSQIYCESSSGISHLCEKLGRMCSGILSSGQQRDLLEQCEKLNLVWVGNSRLSPLEPEHVERIMGYPTHHTRVSGFTPSERLKSLKLSFQTDTLAYHLSVLKRQPLSDKGLAVLSFFTGIGGAEIALHRLGIHLKVVVSVEPCEQKRKIVKHWWENTRQSGELIQMGSIHRISGDRVEDLIKKFGGFDLVLCQNPYSDNVSESLSGLNFSLFVEFVRVLQRVRIAMENNK